MDDVAASLHSVYFLSCPFDIIIVTDNLPFVNRFLKTFSKKFEGLSPFKSPPIAARLFAFPLAQLIQTLTEHQHRHPRASQPSDPNLTAHHTGTKTDGRKNETKDRKQLVDRMRHSSYFLSC
jgi:hypothetical protein